MSAAAQEIAAEERAVAGRCGAAKKGSGTTEALRQAAVTQAGTKDAATKHAATQDPATNHVAKKNPVMQDAVTQAAVAATKDTVTQAATTRDGLVSGYADLVRRIAYRLAGRVPRNIELNDLIQAGMVGLLEAAQRYVDGEGASFATFATRRIRGAMLDSLRKADWSPRSLRRRLRAIDGARQRIEMDTCEAAKTAAITAALGVPVDVYYRTIRDLNGSRLLSLDELLESEIWSTGAEPMDEKPEPDQELEHEQALHALKADVDALPEFERLVLLLYYDQDLLLREIGALLSLSESRVCQIHKGIIKRLRSAARRHPHPAGHAIASDGSGTASMPSATSTR